MGDSDFKTQLKSKTPSLQVLHIIFSKSSGFNAVAVELNLDYRCMTWN